MEYLHRRNRRRRRLQYALWSLSNKNQPTDRPTKPNSLPSLHERGGPSVIVTVSRQRRRRRRRWEKPEKIEAKRKQGKNHTIFPVDTRTVA